jgi:hypothetical protein
MALLAAPGMAPGGHQDTAAGRVQRAERVERAPFDKLFSRIESGFATGNIGVLSGQFSSQVSVSLRGGETGHFSASQAYYLLDNYFRKRRLVNFRFTTVGESESNPYATGSGGITAQGAREMVQVYVSLAYAGDRWVIAQINIY